MCFNFIYIHTFVGSLINSSPTPRRRTFQMWFICRTPPGSQSIQLVKISYKFSHLVLCFLSIVLFTRGIRTCYGVDFLCCRPRWFAALPACMSFGDLDSLKIGPLPRFSIGCAIGGIDEMRSNSPQYIHHTLHMLGTVNFLAPLTMDLNLISSPTVPPAFCDLRNAYWWHFYCSRPQTLMESARQDIILLEQIK